MRITKVTTGQGDRGQTALGDGSRVSKTHPRIECLGVIDELNAQLGQVVVTCSSAPLQRDLKQIQNDLFNLGGEVATPETPPELLTDERIVWLEDKLTKMNSTLPPLKEFVLPGGDEFAARLQLARTVCRRAERRVVALLEQESLNQPTWVRYLNRLSDYLFVLARYHLQCEGTGEQLWQRRG
jgi:cob(I)alamin adenosyltransferase